VSLVPLSEGSSVDLDDGGFGEGVCADEFIVGWLSVSFPGTPTHSSERHTWMIDDTDDTGLASDGLRTP